MLFFLFFHKHHSPVNFLWQVRPMNLYVKIKIYRQYEQYYKYYNIFFKKKQYFYYPEKNFFHVLAYCIKLL